MKTDIVHVTKYEFSFKNEQELKIIQRGGSYLTQNYTDLWIVNLFEDSVYVAFFVKKGKYMDSAILFTLSPEQFRDITRTVLEPISIHEDSMVKGDDKEPRVFYNNDLYKSYNGFPKFIHKP